MRFIIGNWKMFPPTLGDAKDILAKIKKEAKEVTHTRVVICSPALYVTALTALAKNTKVAIGGQNCSKEDEGAYTGEISPRALSDVGASYVIIGHSERRAMGETDKDASEKITAALRNKLNVILCVGERTRDEHGGYFNEVSSELRASLAMFPKGRSKHLIVAYEPIWAIGAKAVRVATPSDFREMSILIRRTLTEYFGKKDAFAIPILYGGSVDDRNAQGFLKEGDADGLLIGRVSLEPEKFGAIIHCADSLR